MKKKRRIIIDDDLPYWVWGLPQKSGHVHEWKVYRGFREDYEYCITCDEKREIDDKGPEVEKADET